MNPSLVGAGTLGRFARAAGGTNACLVRKHEAGGKTSRHENHIAPRQRANARPRQDVDARSYNESARPCVRSLQAPTYRPHPCGFVEIKEEAHEAFTDDPVG